MHSTSIKKIIAGVAAVATAAMGLALAAPAANAADPSTLNVGNINKDTTGTLTIEKHKLTSTPGHTNDSTKQSNVPGDTMQGVTFNVYKVTTTHPLTDPGEWDTLSAIWNGTVNRDSNTIKVGSTTVGTITHDTPTYTAATGSNGQVQFTKVPLGLYYVEEGGYAGSGQILSKASPFLVTMPYPVKGKAWNYDVWVYPKNSFGTTTKQVDPDSIDKTLQVGDDVSWDVDQNVPAQTTDQPLSSFGIVDQLDPNVTYKGVTVQGLDSTGKVTGSVLPATDYSVTYLASDRTTTVTNAAQARYVKVSITDLDAIKNLTAVRFKITTTVSKSLVDPTVENHVFPVINNYNPFNTTGSNPPVNSKNQPFYGDFAFQKVDDQTPAAALNGAHFALWRKDPNQNCATTAPSYAKTAVSGTTDNLGNAVTTDGKVVFQGIYIDTKDVTNGVPASDSVTHDFCLLETQAPAGYVKPTSAWVVNLKAGRNANNPEQINTHDPITNTKQHGPKLPLTGAAGRLLLILGAIAILAAAAALYVVNKRRQNANANR